MTRLERIEADIRALNPDELRRLAEWLEELRAEQWDAQIERDAKAGRLDKLIAEAEADIAAGRVTPL